MHRHFFHNSEVIWAKGKTTKQNFFCCCCCFCFHSGFQCHCEDQKRSFSLCHYTDEEVEPWEIMTVDLSNTLHLDSNRTKFCFQLILLYRVCALPQPPQGSYISLPLNENCSLRSNKIPVFVLYQVCSVETFYFLKFICLFIKFNTLLWFWI